MREEFDRLVKQWELSINQFSAIRDIKTKEFNDLVAYCNKDVESVKNCIEYIKEILMEEPSELVEILPYMIRLAPDKIYYSLTDYCNFWLNVLNNTKDVDYYKEWREYNKYMEENYIPWNPFKEDDPNINFKDYKNGKRNNT